MCHEHYGVIVNRCVGFFVFAVLAMPLQAEVGDYRPHETSRNTSAPFGPDRPVTPAERHGDYPLLSNPEGFADGYDPKAWGKWQTIQLAPDTEAVCGNGSPYKFFINRVPSTSNTVIYMEGGGACVDYESCTGQTNLYARNPNGIPDNYLDITNPAAALVSPFVFRTHPWSRTKVQKWNLVYVPYCTGDIYLGDEIVRYTNKAGDRSIVWHHNGLRNVRAVVAWLRDNVPTPGQLLLTGCSAGGIGVCVNYAHVREDLAPAKGFLINDSGPVYPTPEDANPRDNPSVFLHRLIREAWGLDQGPLPELAERLLNSAHAFDPTDLGSINAALAARFPGDRLGHTHFQADLNFTRFSYDWFFPRWWLPVTEQGPFYPEIANAPTVETRNTLLLERWGIDTFNLIAQLDPLDNYGYHIPYFRDLNQSHCTTIVDFLNADIQEVGLELDDFIDNVLDGEGPVLEAIEQDQSQDLAKPSNPVYSQIDDLL